MANQDDETPAKAPSRLRAIRGQGFAKRLEDAILAANITQSDLSRMTGIGRDSISGYILGKSVPSPAYLDKIVKALQLRREDLQPGAYRAMLAPGKPLMKMTPVDGNPETAWLILHQKMSTRLALQIIEMVKAERKG